MAESPALPFRSRRFGVGKEIGGAVYVHRDYRSRLPEVVSQAMKQLPGDLDFCVIKLTLKTNSVSFIQSPDFDSADEPTVGDSVSVAADGSVSQRRGLSDPWVYHHKWLFVEDDYAGFDVEESKARSRRWLALPDIDFRRIGRRSFWESSVVARLDSQGENAC